MKTVVKKKTAKSKKAVRKSGLEKIKMRDLSKDPYFIKKAEEAKELLRRIGDIIED